MGVGVVGIVFVAAISYTVASFKRNTSSKLQSFSLLLIKLNLLSSKALSEFVLLMYMGQLNFERRTQTGNAAVDFFSA